MLSRYVSWTAFLLKKHLKLASALGTDSSSAFPNEYTAKLPLDQVIDFRSLCTWVSLERPNPSKKIDVFIAEKYSKK